MFALPFLIFVQPDNVLLREPKHVVVGFYKIYVCLRNIFVG